jgi:hypothetical protein
MENFRSPTWNSVSGCRSPSPSAIRPNSARPPVATTTPAPNRAGGLVSGQRLTGQDRFLALQPRGGEQPQISRHHLTQLQVDHVAGHKLGDVNRPRMPLAQHNAPVMDL